MAKGKLIWHIACDESGIDGQVYYGFGSLWMKYQRRGDFVRIIRNLREKYRYTNEIKWQRAHQKNNIDFYKELADVFFKHAWLAFHCIVIRKGLVDKSFHDGDYDLAMRKHFTTLISSKIKREDFYKGRHPYKSHYTYENNGIYELFGTAMTWEFRFWKKLIKKINIQNPLIESEPIKKELNGIK